MFSLEVDTTNLTPIFTWARFNVLQTVLYRGKGDYLIPRNGSEVPIILMIEGNDKTSAHFGHIPKRRQKEGFVCCAGFNCRPCPLRCFPALSFGINCARSTSYPTRCSCRKPARTLFRAVHDPWPPLRMSGFDRTYRPPRLEITRN